MKFVLGNLWKALHFPKGWQLFFMQCLQNRFLIGVTGIVLNNKREVLLFKHTYRSHSWSLPGGYMKKGEHPREALERDIKEESGLVVSVEDMVKIRTDRTIARLDMCYEGVLIGGDFMPSAEVSEYGFFTQDKLPLLRQNQLFLIDEVLTKKPTHKQSRYDE